MKTIASLILLFSSVTALASEKFIPDPANQMKQEGVITVSIPWIKDKGGKFDMNINIHNENTDQGMIVFLSDMSCKRGNVRGVLKHTFFNTGERTIDFKPNETKDFNLVCKIEGDMKGEFQVMISKVYNNPSLDGKTVGKIVAKDLSWKQLDRKE